MTSIFQQKRQERSLAEREQQRLALQRQRSEALQAITAEVGGKVVQVRPQDGQNFQTAIAIGQPQRWILADNSVAVLTVEEMQDALQSGIAQAAEIWDEYATQIEIWNEESPDV